jgi:hypothetical protein
MTQYAQGNIAEAYNSMLRTDYISLNDADKLALLYDYYVDYFNLLPDILSDTDQLVVGRRGTGKTTLLYRALVGCMQSWAADYPEHTAPAPRTLGIYVDLSKCQYLDEVQDGDFAAFEHAFVSEVCDAIADQLTRFWPALRQEPGHFFKLFRAAESNQVAEVRRILERIGQLLREGVPRVVDRSSPVEATDKTATAYSHGGELGINISSAAPLATGKITDGNQESQSAERTYSTRTAYRLTVADVLRILGDLKEKAGLAATYLFVDEFSALSSDLQRRFSTLLKKLLGSHAGVFIKLCAITDKYTLGSAIILQRDLFELSLDLDAFVERSRTLGEAMDGLREYCRQIVESRLSAYGCPTPPEVFDEPEETYSALSRAAMGVPRTLGIVLKQAWARSRQGQVRRIRKSDIMYGVRYASAAYLNQLFGAARDGVAIPTFHVDLWNALMTRAESERAKVPDAAASHFMILARNEQMLSVLNMFFLVHLLTKGRTTKKERSIRSLYCFDFGVCDENNLGFATDKNVIRQQRFAYDDALARFEKYFGVAAEATFRCPQCATVYTESELVVAGTRLTFCPRDKTDLVGQTVAPKGDAYTEEETKIIGTIRSARREDHVFARQIADDVGCYVQKVAKFGEKLDRTGLATRVRDEGEDKLIYYGAGTAQEDE